MASGALVASLMVGAEAFYVKENHGDEIGLADRIVRLPIPSVKYENLHEVQRKILTLALKSGGKLTTANRLICSSINISPQLASYHIKKLNSACLITVSANGRDKTVELTAEGRLFSELYPQD